MASAMVVKMFHEKAMGKIIHVLSIIRYFPPTCTTVDISNIYEL